MRRSFRFAPVVLLSFVVIGALDVAAIAQEAAPAPRDLDRLNLSLAWKHSLPIENRVDGIATLQIIGGQIFVQTRNNVLVVLNESNGEEIWRAALPKRGLPTFPVAVNRDFVCAINGPRLFVLDRTSGKFWYNVELPSTVTAGLAADNRQCFIVLSNETVISVGLQQEDLRRGLASRKYVEPPDEPTGIKLEQQTGGELATTGNKTPSLALLHSLRPPFMDNNRNVTPSLAIVPTLRPPYRIETPNRTPSIQMMSNLSKESEYTEIVTQDKPRILWELKAYRRMDDTPLMFGEFLIIAGADRSVFVCSKYADRQNHIRHEYLSDAVLSAPIAQYGSDLFLSVADGNVYQVSVEDFRNNDVPVKHIKRYLVGFPVKHTPIVTDESVYLDGSQAGVTRLDRVAFDKVWSNSEVDRVLAVNRNVVYTSDRRGNLVVLDRARGLKLAALDIHQFDFPVANHQDDRLFLASKNGMLLCLHDRSMRRSEILRPKEPKPLFDPQEEPTREGPKKEVEPKKEPAPKKEEPEAKKEAEPKKDDPDAKKDPEPKKDN